MSRMAASVSSPPSARKPQTKPALAPVEVCSPGGFFVSFKMKLWTVFRAHVCHVSSGFKLCVDTDAPDIEMQLAVSCRAGLPKEAIAPPPDRSHMQVPKLTVGDRFTTLAIASLSFLVGMWGKKQHTEACGSTLMPLIKRKSPHYQSSRPGPPLR